MPSSTRSVRILLTASEAFPALERAFLGANSEIWASFLVFDLKARLRSPEALAVGRTWFDLVVHTLNRGVSLHFSISDFDPIKSAPMHQATRRHLRMFSAAAALANPGAKLNVLRPRHPAQAGLLVRLAVWPSTNRKLAKLARGLNVLMPEHRAAALRDMDGTAQMLMVRHDGTVTVRFWVLPRLFPVVHHQKLVVIDRKALYIGGLDLDERRSNFPTDKQVGNQASHGLQLLIEGPVVAEAQEHLETFNDVIEGRLAPPRTRRLLRTLSRPRRSGLLHHGPDPVAYELKTAHLILTRRAKHLIYIENKSFCDIDLARALAETAHRSLDLQLILILSATPNGVTSDGRRSLASRYVEVVQARALRILQKGFMSRLFVGSPLQMTTAVPVGRIDQRIQDYDQLPAEVHAKVSIFDDTSAIVSSANFNTRGLQWDTEAGVYLTNANDVIELRHRIIAHWLPANVGDDTFISETAAQSWANTAWRNAATPVAERDSQLLPYSFAMAKASGRTLPIAPTKFA